MISNEALVNALRKLGFRHKRQTERVNIMKLQGGTTRVSVTRNRRHDKNYARTILRQAGMVEAEIEKFLTQCDDTLH